MICRNCVTDNQQHHLPPNTAPLAGNSLIQHLTPAPLPGSSLIWRRYGGGVGNRCRWDRQICVCLSSSNPVDRYNLADRPFPRSRELFRTDRGRPCPREWEDPQAKRCGGMERSGSLCGRVAAPRETRQGKQPAGREQLRKATCRQGAPSGSSCRQG